MVASVSRLGLTLPDLADPGPAGPLVGLVHPDRTRIITASDADEEIRQQEEQQQQHGAPLLPRP